MATSPGVSKTRPRLHRMKAGRAFSSGLFVVILGCSSQSAIAQDWEMDALVELIATYTDNLYLLPDGAEIPDYVGQINPGFSILKDQGRFTTDTTYRLQSVYFADDSDLNTVYHQLDANAEIEVATDAFFVSMDASVDQTVVDPSRRIPTSNVLATDNLGDEIFGNVNPYLVQRLGNSGTYIRADYVWGIGRYENFGLNTFSRVDDFTQNVWGLYLGTDDQETGIEWSLTYDQQLIDYETITDYEFERLGAAFGIPITRNFRLIALGGVETDVFLGRNIGGLDSDYWEFGFRANFGQRNVLEIRTGERFFGTSYFGNFEYDGRVFQASVSYMENPTTSALDGPGSAVGTFSVTVSDPIFDDEPGTDEIIIIPIRTDAYISKRLQSRIEFSGGKGLLFFAYADEEREFIENVQDLGGTQEGENALTAGYRYQLGPRTELELNAALVRYDFADTFVSTDIRQVTVGVTRQLGSETNLRLSLRHAEQETDSVAGFDNYTENAIDLGLMKRF